jgi:hypothetical protein
MGHLSTHVLLKGYLVGELLYWGPPETFIIIIIIIIIINLLPAIG